MVAGVGELGVWMDRVRDGLAGSAAFQTWVGAEDADEAKGFVFDFEAGADDPAKRAVLSPGKFTFQEHAGGVFGGDHEVLVVLEGFIDAGDVTSARDGLKDFVNTLGQVLDELRGESDVGNAVGIRFMQVYHFEYSPPEQWAGDGGVAVGAWVLLQVGVM